MKLSAFFPTRDIGNDPAKIRDWAQAAEALGYVRIEVPDHVLGAGTASRPDWKPTYAYTDPFHETFVTLGFLAACTRSIGLASGVLIAPQRQTALVAKQAAEVDVLSGGRLRLSIGVGWNPVEYEALGTDWHTRGRRQAEQVGLLRRLWTEELVTFEGRWDRIEEAGLNPLPVQRPIPIWFGGSSDAVVKRAARLGDGWIPIMPPDEAGPKLDALHGHLQEAGRNPADFGVAAWLRMHDFDPQRWAAAADGWRAHGAETVTLYPMWRIPKFDDQIALLERFREVAGG
ncbi:putative F420-dependent oxidoreductase [Constrictibacter sp. MBR-5]|jgi:probable F420-dependent oxidoreductase|uniref:LLM class F420-dependent oxidoreductase n=1 Tax=Constrictibacter sp. MBR-5 TaxID=3156467 RepID=UPI00339361E9